MLIVDGNHDIVPKTATQIIYKQQCPTPEEILYPSCVCYSPTSNNNYITCNNVSGWFNLTKNYHYHIKSLYIINTPNLPLLTERFYSSQFNFNHRTSVGVLQVDNLIFRQTSHSPVILPTMDNMEDLFGLTSNSVKIVSTGDDYNSLQPLDVSSQLSVRLHHLTLVNIQRLIGLDLDKFESLRRLQLINITTIQLPSISDLFLFNSSLRHIEITNTSSLNGSFVYQPRCCNLNHNRQKQEIHFNESLSISTLPTVIYIDLRNNSMLEFFDFGSLFCIDHNSAINNQNSSRKNNDNCYCCGNRRCRYHIDLSGNQRLRSNLLTSQAATILYYREPGDFYLILRNVPNLCCDQSVVELYRRHRGYIHNVQCANVQTTNLDKRNTIYFLDQLAINSSSSSSHLFLQYKFINC